MNASNAEIIVYPRNVSAEMKEVLLQHDIWYSSKGKEGRQAQLVQLDLAYTMVGSRTFDGAELVQANMVRSCLRGSTFRGARLHGANFRGADLRFANFEGADLRGASFEDADLSYANFDGAILERARFLHANLESATFRGADLTATEFVCCAPCLKNLKGAKASNNTVNALLDAVAGLDTLACTDEIRTAVEQIKAIYAAAREEQEAREKANVPTIEEFLAGFRAPHPDD